ncbi:MAG: ZIP family metal transporter [Bacilli bacterium]|nr:ZIP family metal transporter [Bacilli bacterium]MDD3896196.1 ZIP family metal transporter [Bacilli bacterium]MDD4407948.1 ZIP family metal transporter [Bacilli bacterium]
MIDFFCSLNPLTQTIIASLGTFFINSLGAATIFLFKNINKRKMDILLSISAGVMLASTFFSLINPALDYGKHSLLMCVLGILFGGLLLFVGDKIYNTKDKTNMLVLSMTLHNFPEGMAIGIAFGAAINGIPGATIMGALTLAIGIGIQNFPEGSALSFPLYKKGNSKFKSFLISTSTAAVEPIGAIIGLYLALKLQMLLPFFLAFAAGAMLYVIVIELIPESMASKNNNKMAIYLILGFIIMMTLDVALG